MTSTPRRLLDALAIRNFDAIAECFATEASMRVLTPRGLRELFGPTDAADRFRAWFGDMEGFELLDSEVAEVADRVRIRWRTRGRDPDKGWQENDHTGYATLDDDDLITALNVSCAGFRAVPAP